MPAKLTALALVTLAIAIPTSAGQSAQPAPSKPNAASTAKPDDERTKRGKALLSQAEAEAGGLDGEMRAYALLQAARAYTLFDRERAKGLLEQAYTASQVNHEDTPSKTRLVEEILIATAQVAPERVEELLPYSPPEGRARVLDVLLGYYLKNKQFDRAKEMVLRAARESDFPHRAATQLMSALPKEDSVDRQAIFGAALTSFKSSPSKGGMLLGLDQSGLGGMVLRFWRDLPVALVKEAIDALLEDARKRTSDAAQPVRIAIASSKQSSSFNSLYEYRLQQLLPVLRQIDESEANKLAEELKRLNPSLDADAGVPSAPGTADGQDGAPSEARMEAMVGPGPSPAASAMLMQMRQVAAIEDVAQTNLQDALMKASGLASTPRTMALEIIARMTIQKDPSVARKALEQLLETAKDLKPEEQSHHLAGAAELYLRLRDESAARKAIEKGVDAAEKLFKQDSDRDDANQALKAYWPSSGAWKRFIRLASRISQQFAVSLVNEISDPEIKAVQRLALASDLLNVPAEPMATMVSRKDRPTQMMIEIGDEGGEEEIPSR